MIAIEPRLSHPYYWVLTGVLQLTARDVSKRSGVPLPTVKSMAVGHAVKSPQLEALAALARKVVADVAAHASIVPTSREHKLKGDQRHWYVTDELRIYRRAVYAVVEHVLTAFGPPPARPRATLLSERLLAAIGSAGAPRARVLVQLKGGTTTFAIRRCAERLGVETTQREGRTWWLPPPDLKPLAPTPKLKPHIRQSPRASLIQQALERYLIKRPDGARATEVIAHVRQRAGCSKTQVFRAARDLLVQRTTHGFGPGKHTTWIYQAAIDALHVKPVDPSAQ